MIPLELSQSSEESTHPSAEAPTGSSTKPNSPLAPLAAALQFLTVLPPLVRRPFTPQEMGAAVGYFPLVGLFLGIFLAGAYKLIGQIFPSLVSASLLLIVWVLLTGALHLDGFLDACDGLLGGWTPEHRLEIMRDEHHGAYALAGGILLILLKFTTLISLVGYWQPLVLAPILGRWAMVLALAFFPYARSEGVGRAMRDHVSWKQVVLGTLIGGVTAVVLGSWRGLVAATVVGGIVWVGAKLTLRLIPGLTGDVYGALNELAEISVLLVFVTVKPL